MKRWTRRGLWAAGSLLGLATAAVVAGLALAEWRMNRHIELRPSALLLHGDAQALERGRYLYASRGCADCHGANAGGRTFVDDGRGLKLAGPDISPGGVTRRYAAADWERTLRHGVKPDGRPLRIMPAEDYSRWTDADVAAVASWLRQLPAASGPTVQKAAVVQLPLPVRVLYGYGLIPDAASKIDHRLPPATPVAEGVTVEHGRYVANMCVGCHGAQLGGGKIAGAPPDWPAAANLRAAETLARYGSAEALMAMFRSGRRPDGSAIQVMPFEALGQLSETDARALHLYLTSRRSG